MSRRLSALLLAALLWVLPLSACAAAEAGPFSDVSPDAPYASAVAWCCDRGLMDGVGNGKFDPEGTLTRAMLATVLYRAADKPAVSSPLPFTDAVAGSWYADALVWAESIGLMQGYGDGRFGTDDPVSVEMLEVVVSRRTGGSQAWTGDPAKAIPANRAQVAAALMGALSSPAPAPEREGGKVLVAYFSCTNTTGAVAQLIAQATGGDLFRIELAEPYSDADLNYHNNSCRANREQNDAAARQTADEWVKGLDLPTAEKDNPTLMVSFNGRSYSASLADNPSARAFADHLRANGGAVTVHAHDYGSFEKVGPLGADLVQTNEPIDTVPGDIILYQGSSVCLYYAANSWNFTRLGKLEGDLSRLKADLGDGNVDVTYALTP